MKATLTPEEFEDWRQFYTRWPFDDLHRFHRPAALVAAHFGGDFEKALSVLHPPVQDPDDPLTDVDRQVFSALMKG